MDQLVTEIIRHVVESLMIPIKKHVGYVVSSSNYVGEMGTRMTELNGKKVDIEKHREENKINDLEIPHRVSGWLKEVETIKAEAESIPTDVNGCFNVTMRYKAGRDSSNILPDIDRLIKEEFKWTNHQKPLGKVASKKASTHTPSRGSTQNDFESRELIFNDALKSLEPGNPTKMIALCGMGGVGKTTMMEQLKKAVEDKKMFYWIVKAVIGERVDPIAFQGAITQYIGQSLTETTKDARADRLRKRFEEISEDGKNKILVILDDVWEMVDLKDIGLSPLPNQGVDFKLLLTSRDKNICTQMGVEIDSVFRVDRLTDLEAESFFGQIAGLSQGLDPEVDDIGKGIVRRCGGLPIAIKIIASILKYKNIDAWRSALSHLEHHDLDDPLHKIFEMSYNNLKKDDHKGIFLLSGLFPDDFDIPVEDLMRYGWGLKLFKKVSTLAEARPWTNTCIGDLISANLLIESDHVGCVKMHDLLRAFVLSNFSKVKQASIVNHSQWPTQDTSESYERILLKCTDMCEFPLDFKYPNLTFLKLMHRRDKLLKFPEDFYERMEKLEVVAYESIYTPLLPVTLQYSTKLRTLCLRSCSLMDDLSLLGNLINLEILSFADCEIRKLPSTIGKLRKLKLLDLTGCVDLRIDDGVFQNLVHLEELYMRVSDSKVVRFTDANCDELERLSSQLFALVLEFFENKAQPKNVSFEKLERFMISVGCLLEDNKGSKGNDIYSFENTLKLVTNCNDLLEWKIDELFKKTKVLHLQVNGMNDLGDVFVHSPPPSLYNLRVLKISNCTDLRYLFTVHVASGLTKLERLTISSCPIMEALVYIGDSGAQEIKFQELKFLFLDDLPKLVSLCSFVNVIELPQLVELRLDGLPNVTSIFPENKSTTSSMSSTCSAVEQPFLNNEVVIPKLEILEIRGMKNLKEIWPCEITGGEKVNMSTLRVIKVERCDSLVNLFPSNPLRILHHLEELQVDMCGSIEVLFNIDLECVHRIEEESSKLRRIIVTNSGKLREIWRMNGINSSAILVNGFQAVEYIKIEKCESFRNVFTPIITNFDLGGLKDLTIRGSSGEEERARGAGARARARARGVEDLEESGKNTESVENSQEQEDLEESGGEDLEESGKNTESVESSQEQEDLEESGSEDLEESGSNTESHIQVVAASWSLCQYARFIHIRGCDALSNVIPSYAIGQMQKLEVLDIIACNSMMEVFTFSTLESLKQLKELTIENCKAMQVIVKEENGEHSTTSKGVVFPRLESLTLVNLPNLKGFFLGMNDFQWPLLDKVKIDDCPQMMVFTSGHSKAPKLNYMHTSLGKHSLECGLNFRVTTTLHETPFPSLDRANSCPTSEGIPWHFHNLIEIDMGGIWNVKNIIPSNELLQLQKLEKIKVSGCDGTEGVFEALEGTNSCFNESQSVVKLPNLREVELQSLYSLKYIWKSNEWTMLEFPNLKRVFIDSCERLEHVFTCSMVGSLLQLQELHISDCKSMEVIVKETNVVLEEEGDAKVNEIILPCLKSLKLEGLSSLKGFCLGKEDFSWPSLDTLEIKNCPEITIFTGGHSATPKLEVIDTSFGMCYVREDLNTFINTKQQEEFVF